MKTINFFAPLLFLGCFACSAQPSEVQDSTATETNSIPMDTTHHASELSDAVSEATTKRATLLNGTLQVAPQNRASITLPINCTIKSCTLLPGASISKGAVLARVENPEFIALQQTYLESSAQTEWLEAEYSRQSVLTQQDASSQKKLQQSKADFLSMKSRKESAAAQLILLGVDPETLSPESIQPYLTVKAPISGYLASTQMNIGKLFLSGEPLCEIVDKNAPLLQLTAYEKDLPLLYTGDTISFHVNGLGDRIFQATILSIGEEVNEINRAIDVYARVLTPSPSFRPGMYVSAQIAAK